MREGFHRRAGTIKSPKSPDGGSEFVVPPKDF